MSDYSISIIEWIISHGCEDIISNDKMNVIDNLDIKEFKNFLSQATLIAHRLSNIYVHHNNLILNNFRFRMEQNIKKYYVTGWDSAQVFHKDFKLELPETIIYEMECVESYDIYYNELNLLRELYHSIKYSDGAIWTGSRKSYLNKITSRYYELLYNLGEYKVS